MKKEKFKAACPICGRTQCSANPGAEIDINCSKCGQYLHISVNPDGISCCTIHNEPPRAS